MTDLSASESNAAGVPPVVVTRDTRLTTTVGSVLAVMALVFGGHNYIDTRFDSLERALDRIERRTGNRWTYADMKFWVQELSRVNPTIKVPAAHRQPTDEGED